MNNLQTTIEAIQLRIKEEGGNILVNLEDVARGLGFTVLQPSGNLSIRWSRIDTYLSEFGITTTNGRASYISESMFYLLAMKANNKTAKDFQIKVATEIIPNYRKKTTLPSNFREALVALIQSEDEKTELKEQLAIAEPKAKYCDTVLQSNVKLFTPTEICIELGFKSALMLNRVLNDKKIIRKVNGSWCLRAKYADTGLVFNKPYWKDEKILSYNLKWTEKGRALLHSLSLKE